MSWDVWLSLLGTAASIAGLTVTRANVKKLAFVVLLLLGATLSAKGIAYERDIRRVQGHIMDALGPTLMSADQLYDNMNTASVTRPLFDDALGRAVDERRLAHRLLELRTADGVYIKVRAYSAR